MEPEIVFNVQHGPFWDWRVAVDLFLGGAGVGAILFAILIDEIFQGRYRRICQTAAWLSPILVLGGLLFLLLKIGRPFRLPLVYVNFNFDSPLWWGSVFQPLLLVLSIWYALMWNRSQQTSNPVAPHRGRRILGRVLAPLAVIVGGYHGLLLAVIAARPLWNNGPTVVSAMLGFAATGIAAVMLVHLLRMRIAGRLADEEHLARFLDDMRCVRNTLVGVLVLQLGTFFLWWLSLAYGPLQADAALAAANEVYGPLFWWGGIGVGLIFPLLVGAFGLLRRAAQNRHIEVALITVTSATILAGGFAFRLAVVLGGQLEIPMSGIF